MGYWEIDCLSIISHNWVRQNLPGYDVRDISELLGMAERDLKAANGTDLRYKGWVELIFSSVKGESERNDFKVPFLVAKDSLAMPIVGFNVIEEITRNSEFIQE